MRLNIVQAHDMCMTNSVVWGVLRQPPLYSTNKLIGELFAAPD